MPTIREIAETCNVSKPTVTAKLKELNLWDNHVSKVGKTFEVTHEAASAVAAKLVESVEETERPIVPQKQITAAEIAAMDVYSEYIETLKKENERLWEQIREKEERLREKDALIAELTRKLAENQPRPSFWSRLLPRGKSE